MEHPDDYRDEMDRLTTQTAEDVLSGRRSSGGAARVAGAAADRLRQALLVPPSPQLAERHLAAMRAATGSPGIRRGNAMQMRTRKGFATLGLAATLVLGAGLAAALTLPEQASDEAKEQVADVQLPAQATGPGTGGSGNDGASAQASDHGKAVSAAAQDDSTEGCEHGRAVSEIASSKADDNRKNEGDHPGDCGPNDSNNGNQGLSNNGNHGEGNNGNRGRSADANEGSNAGGNGKIELPHGTETAPGQAKEKTSQTGRGPGA
jgi:hypothetical protein